MWRVSAGRVRERSLRAEWCAVALRVWLAFGRVAGVRLRSVCVRVAPARPRADGRKCQVERGGAAACGERAECDADGTYRSPVCLRERIAYRDECDV